MALASGGKFGSYEIQSPLGAGGMGEVYRAHDTKLHRDVALKILPEAFAKETERMARFQREAQVLASLNHPGIASIYGLEDFAATRALVMELVEGPTLEECIAHGAIPVHEALPIAKQISEALEYAHEKGIIHRDLKSANIKLTKDNQVKVLDFGLAKALEGESSHANISDSPTLTAAATQAGVILGTAAYMSPEQAKGRQVDKRADIWAFGCVLYEMLTGKRAFDGETVSDVLAAVIRAEPDWERLPATTPTAIQTLVRRCLQKDPKQRLQAIGDARIAIEETFSGTADVRAVHELPLQPHGWRPALPWTLTTVFALALIGSLLLLWQRPRPASRPVERFALPLPAGDLPLGFGEGPGVALSPDGTKLVYVATRAPYEIHLRRLDALQDTPIPGTEGAQAPFSPDGQWTGFFANGKLKKVSTEGGAPVTLADAPLGRGATWAPDSTIVFSPSPTSGLMRVSDAGGKVETLTTPDADRGQRTHRWPELLPGGKAVLFLIGKLTSPAYYDDSEIAVLSLETGKYRVVLQHAAMVRYAATSESTGYIIYAHTRDLFAVPLYLERLEVTGQVVPVVQGVSEMVGNGSAHFALSRNGSLVYSPGCAEGGVSNLIWMDGKGGERAIPAPLRGYGMASLSPDGQRVAVNSFPSKTGALSDIGIYDFGRNTLTRLTFTGDNTAAAWTPDGRRVAFYSARAQNPGLYWEPADGSQPPELLTRMTSNGAPTSFSPDGKFLAFVQVGTQTGADIWVLPLQGERKPRPFAQEPFNEGWASFSPDGRWLAYMSDESGLQEIYVRPFPGPGGKWQVSSGGGNYPAWARSGRELFYVNGDKLMAAHVETSPTFSAGTPQMIFEKVTLLSYTRLGLGPYLSKPFDVAPDGKRFLVVKQSVSAPTQINLVLNWFEELKRLAEKRRP